MQPLPWIAAGAAYGGGIGLAGAAAVGLVPAEVQPAGSPRRIRPAGDSASGVLAGLARSMPEDMATD